jgi:hypothetical protein
VKKVTISLLVAIVFVLALAVPLFAQANYSEKPAKPLSITCSPCDSDLQWNGSQTGGLTTLFVPKFTATGSNFLNRYFTVADVNTGDAIEVGVAYNFDPGCAAGAVTTGEWYYAIYTSSGSHSATCASFFSGDTGHTAEVGVSPNGNGVDIWIHNTGSTVSPCPPCHISGTHNSWNAIVLTESVQNTWSGTLQGKWHWTSNQYHNSTGFHDQQVSGSITLNYNGVPQMYWDPSPSGESNEGGSLATCEKDSGRTC